MLDAIVIGGGPSGLGASLALSGWQPHLVTGSSVADRALSLRLKKQVPADGLIPLDALPALAAGLRGRSNNPLALFFDALQHPGVDQGRPLKSCLALHRAEAGAEAGAASGVEVGPLRHLVLDPAPPGGSWHSMHESTRTLSPGPWMELPGFTLADYLQSIEPSLGPAAAAARAEARQPRRLVAEYYRAAAAHFDVARHYRPWRVSSVELEPGPAEDGAAVWTVHVDGVEGSPLRARSLVLGVGTYGVPRTLGIPGEELPLVVRRCAACPLGVEHRPLAPPRPRPRPRFRPRPRRQPHTPTRTQVRGAPRGGREGGAGGGRRALRGRLHRAPAGAGRRRDACLPRQLGGDQGASPPYHPLRRLGGDRGQTEVGGKLVAS